MSHLGLGILYDILNRQEDIWAERAYAQHRIWRRSCGLPVRHWRAWVRHPLKDFHLLG